MAKRGRKFDSLPVLGIEAPRVRVPDAPALAPWLSFGNIIKVGRYFAVVVGLPEHETGGAGSHFGSLTPAIAIRRVTKSGYFCARRHWVPLRVARRVANSWRVRLRALIAYRERMASANGPWEVAAREPDAPAERAWSVKRGYKFEAAAAAAAIKMQNSSENKVEPLAFFARLSDT